VRASQTKRARRCQAVLLVCRDTAIITFACPVHRQTGPQNDRITRCTGFPNAAIAGAPSQGRMTRERLMRGFYRDCHSGSIGRIICRYIIIWRDVWCRQPYMLAIEGFCPGKWDIIPQHSTRKPNWTIASAASTCHRTKWHSRRNTGRGTPELLSRNTTSITRRIPKKYLEELEHVVPY